MRKVKHTASFKFTRIMSNLGTSVIAIAVIKLVMAQSELDVANRNFETLYDHTTVTEKDVYAYLVAILKKEIYISAGAMISDVWVLTAADALHLLQDFISELRVRIGSVNYKKGGLVLPIKYISFHPYYDERKPDYDLAMLKLSQPIRRTSNISPIRFSRVMKELTTTHFIVTAWTHNDKAQFFSDKTKDDSKAQRDMLLTVRQMHPIDPNECRIQQNKFDIVDTGTLLCLNFNINSDRCITDAGAPVVLNGVLWGIVSSWRPQDCKIDSGPTFVNLVAAPNVSSWINAVLRDLLWQMRKVDGDDENTDEI